MTEATPTHHPPARAAGRRRRSASRVAASALLFVLLAACGDVQAPSSALTIAVEGLPDDDAAAVVVRDDAGESQFTGAGRVEGLPPGLYTVHADAVTVGGVAYRADTPEQRVDLEAGMPRTVRVAYEEAADGGTTPASAGARGVVQGDSLHGVLWRDVDGDGRFGRGDAVLSRETVVLDLDGDGERDDGDPAVTTDRNGQYRFTGLTPGSTFVLRHGARSGGGLAIQANTGETTPDDASHFVWHGSGSGAAGRIP